MEINVSQSVTYSLTHSLSIGKKLDAKPDDIIIQSPDGFIDT